MIEKNELLGNLVVHFGSEHAMRIYACAIITLDVHSDKCADIAQAIRFTIGMVKRIRRVGYKLLTWQEAIDRLEVEQQEGRHYGFGAVGNDSVGYDKTLAGECKKIESRNDGSFVQIMPDGTTINHTMPTQAEKTAQAIAKRKATMARQASIINSLKDMAIDATKDKAEIASELHTWVKAYWDSISKTKRAKLTLAVKAYKAGTLDAKTQNTIQKRYTVQGLGALDFLELMVRYA